MRTPAIARGIAIVSVALLSLTACSGGEDDGAGAVDTGGNGVGDAQTNVYGVDGNMGDALGESIAEDGVLAGMKGTTPLVSVSSGFRKRLDAMQEGLQDYDHAAETYDAIVITALAAQLAGTNDAQVVKGYVNGVTFGGDSCTDFAGCVDIINRGGNPDYDGTSGPLAFTDAGEPSVASFGILEFGTDNTVDESLTGFAWAGDEENAATDEGPTPADQPATGEPLLIGTLLPLTGNIAFRGPAVVAGARLAVAEINEAGGVLGEDVEMIEGDSGDAATETAKQTVDRFLQRGVNAIVGAVSSAVSLAVIDAITGADVLQFSPANTADDFTSYDDSGLYFRTAPPDALQARALADLVVADGNESVGILALNDPYGTGLAESTKRYLIESGLAEFRIRDISYDPQVETFDTEVQQMVDFAPDAVVVIGFDESARIVEALDAHGLGPASD